MVGTWMIQYHRGRFYDYRTGRWLNQDPIGYQDGPNLYAYVHSNPINRTDPQGLWGICYNNHCLGDSEYPSLVFGEYYPGGPDSDRPSFIDHLMGIIELDAGYSACVTAPLAPLGPGFLYFKGCLSVNTQNCCTEWIDNACVNPAVKVCLSISGQVEWVVGRQIPLNDRIRAAEEDEPISSALEDPDSWEHGKGGSAGFGSGGVSNCSTENEDVHSLCFEVGAECTLLGRLYAKVNAKPVCLDKPIELGLDWDMGISDGEFSSEVYCKAYGKLTGTFCWVIGF